MLNFLNFSPTHLRDNQGEYPVLVSELRNKKGEELQKGTGMKENEILAVQKEQAPPLSKPKKKEKKERTIDRSMIIRGAF